MQTDGLVVVLYVANQATHNLLWFPPSHNKIEIKTLVLLWRQKTY